MQYMLLIHGENDPSATPPPADAEPSMEEMAPWFEYDAAIQEAGVVIASHALLGPETGTGVQVRDGDRLLTDGPFTETKEFLGGYYVIDVDDLDQALDWAARCPGALDGTVEVRPVMLIPEA